MLFQWLGIKDSIGLDVVVHMCLEAIGGLIYVAAFRFCEHKWHRVAVWFILAPPMAYATVNLVG